MLKTGLAGSLPGHMCRTIMEHPHFLVTGSFYAEPQDHQIKNDYLKDLPGFSRDKFIEENDVLFFYRSDHNSLETISYALKHSKHVMIIDAGRIPYQVAAELIKLREEAQTVFKIRQNLRSIPLLRSCHSLMDTPSIIEIKVKKSSLPDNQREWLFEDVLYKIADILLLLNPANVKRIRAFQQPDGIFCNNMIESRVEFENGVVANLLLTDIATTDSFTVNIYQKNRMFKIDILKEELTIFERSETDPGVHSESNILSSSDEQILNIELDLLNDDITTNNSSGKELYHVFRVAELSSRIIEKSDIFKPA